MKLKCLHCSNCDITMIDSLGKDLYWCAVCAKVFSQKEEKNESPRGTIVRVNRELD
jgi:hypothetical protein